MNSQLKQLLQHETGDIVTEARVAVAVEPLATAAQVWEKVRSFLCESGWVCLTDQVKALYSGNDLADLSEGVILSAELAGNGQSLHIRQAETGWCATTITVGSGEPCLMLSEQYLSTENKQQARLSYEVYWKVQDGVCRPWVARLAALVKGGSN